MSVAGATLIVGMALVIVAVAAQVLRLVLPAEDTWSRIAGQHLEPLGTWALAVLALHALALLFSGTGGLGAWVLVAVLAGAALVLRASGEEYQEDESRSATRPMPAEPVWAERRTDSAAWTVPLPAVVVAPPTGEPVRGMAPPQSHRRSLWSEDEADDVRARAGLWSQ